jgi:hypothetical protein
MEQKPTMQEVELVYLPNDSAFHRNYRKSKKSFPSGRKLVSSGSSTSTLLLLLLLVDDVSLFVEDVLIVVIDEVGEVTVIDGKDFGLPLLLLDCCCC